jgi:hypothetical protein
MTETMGQSFETTGRVERGKLKLRNRQAFETAFKTWRDGEVIVRIERRHAARSLAQNAYYWGVAVHLLSEHTGYTPDEMHEFLKMKFLPKKLAVQDKNGEVQGEFVIGGTTTALNKIQFGEYLFNIQSWAAASLDVQIPDPNEEAA